VERRCGRGVNVARFLASARALRHIFVGTGVDASERTFDYRRMPEPDGAVQRNPRTGGDSSSDAPWKATGPN
jgi:hypothetical protein